MVFGQWDAGHIVWKRTMYYIQQQLSENVCLWNGPVRRRTWCFVCAANGGSISITVHGGLCSHSLALIGLRPGIIGIIINSHTPQNTVHSRTVQAQHLGKDSVWFNMCCVRLLCENNTTMLCRCPTGSFVHSFCSLSINPAQ